MHNYQENLDMAIQTLLAHKFRSFLTVLGIVIGVLTVIVIASILGGMRQNIVSYVQDFGTNNIFAFHLGMGPQAGRRPREERMRRPLTVEDALAIKEQCPSVQDVAWDGIPWSTRVHIQYQQNTLRNSSLQGVASNWGSVSGLKLSAGRFFTELEDRHRMRVVALGADASDAMFPQQDPIGKRILVNGYPFIVVGVMQKSAGGIMAEGSGRDNVVLIPYRTFHKLMPWEDNRLILIQARPGMLSRALDETRGVLRRRRGVKADAQDDFDLTTADRFIQQFDSITASVGLITMAVSSIGLLVGGIGVMNIMLVSVTERTSEIGIRKAVGATRKDIVFQFLFEAMTLTGLGGVFGVLLAVAVSYLIVALIPSLPATIQMWAVLAGLCISVAIGLVFGVWPAQKAARLDPIEALRHE